MLAAGDVNKETIELTPDNIDDYIGLQVCETPKDYLDFEGPISVCFKNKRLDDGYAVFECSKVEGTYTFYLPDTTLTIEDYVEIFNFFSHLSSFYSEWDAQYFADNTKVSEILSPLGDYSITISYVSVDNPTVNIEYRPETNQRKFKYGLNSIECTYCVGNEF